jgi:hypothetical protein
MSTHFVPVNDEAAQRMPPRLEVALVRELEIAYSAGTPPAAVKHASPYQWANACHDLLEAGRIDILEHAARHLHAIYPELTYIATIVAWFDAIPGDLPGLLPFRDDPAAEVQVLGRDGCDAVLLCFCAREGTLGLPLNLVHRWLGRVPASLVYIKDFHDLYGGRGYPSLAPDRRSSVKALRSLVEELDGKRTFTLGVSLGGYPALYYGLELGAAGALSLAGDTDLTAEFNEQMGPLPPPHRNLLQQTPDYAQNLREHYASWPHRPRVILAFSTEQPRDRQQAERMSGLPNVQLLPVEHYPHHNVVDPLIRRGQFMNVLYRLLDA